MKAEDIEFTITDDERGILGSSVLCFADLLRGVMEKG